MLIGGDLNLPDVDWNSNSMNGNQYLKAINQCTLDMVNECHLKQIVNEPTRGENILDVFMTNRPSLVNKCVTIPGLGDHDAVHIQTDTRAKRVKPVRRKILLWNKADIDSLKNAASEINNEFLHRFNAQSPIDSMWKYIKSSMEDLMTNHVPSKMSTTRYNQPWITREIKRLTRQKQKRYNQAKGKHKQSKEYRRFRKLKRRVEKKCKDAYSQYMKDIISPDTDKNNKRFWSFIKNQRKDNTGVAPLYNKEGILHSDSKEKANILNTQFSDVFNKNEDTTTIQDKGESSHPEMAEITITENGVRKLLQKLDGHKATGPDDIPARLLKETAAETTHMLTTLFQASLHQGKLPTEWKTANVIPAYKKGSKSQPENYRPISLTCILCKVMEHIISSNLMSHLEDSRILTDAQYGFRKKRSCETQLLNTVNNLAKSLDDKSQVDTILLDFSKAFDKVPHQRLLYKLQYYGVRGYTHKWIADFLNERTQRVVLDGCSSDFATVDSGVPKGSVLGPVLFLAYINDLPEYLTNGSSANLFADDSILYRSISNTDDARKLQQDLENLQTWEKDWQMEFHPKKCQVLNITNKKKPVKFTYTIHGHVLETVKSAKYLGVNIQAS